MQTLHTQSLHATAIAFAQQGVLLMGAPGVGKTDVALMCMQAGATLIADDQVELVRRGETLWAAAPAALAGRMQVHGVGIIRCPVMVTGAPVTMVCELVTHAHPAVAEGVPNPQTINLLGCDVPHLVMAATRPAVVSVIKLVLQLIKGHGTITKETTIVGDQL